MITTLTGISKLWFAGFALVAIGSVSGCISDDSDPAEDTGGGGTSGSGGTTGGSSTGGSSTGGTSGTTATGTACEAPITIPTSTPGIANFDDYSGNADLAVWSFPLGSETATGVTSGTFGYGDDVGGFPENFEMVAGNDSTYALSISDVLAEEYGGGMGLWMSACLDARAFTGISFWVRGNSPTGDAKLTLLMEETTSAMPATPTGKKGTCPGIDSGDAPTCVHPSYVFAVTDTWTQIQVPWTSVTAGRAVSTPVVVDGHNIWQIQFDVGLVWADNGAGVYEPTPSEYEFVIDSMTFY
jgi:hypothetical protein